MKKYKIVFWFGCLLLLTLNACYYDEVLPVEKTVGDVGTVLFVSDLIPIFNLNCNISGCHSAGGQRPNLTASNAYASLSTGGYINNEVPEKSEIYLWMKGVKGTPMPVSGSNATFNAKVLAWIKQGAQNN